MFAEKAWFCDQLYLSTMLLSEWEKELTQQPTKERTGINYKIQACSYGAACSTIVTDFFLIVQNAVK